jgi:hypothetical protein
MRPEFAEGLCADPNGYLVEDVREVRRIQMIADQRARTAKRLDALLACLDPGQLVQVERIVRQMVAARAAADRTREASHER